MGDSAAVASSLRGADSGHGNMDLPDGWATADLGDLFDIQQGKALSPKHREGKSPRPFLRTANVLWGRLNLDTVDEMDFTDEEAERLSLQNGDLLVCEGGDVGRTAIWRDEIRDCSYQNHVHRLRTTRKDLVPEFYMYWMQVAMIFLGIYEGAENRTTIPNLSKGRLSRFRVPVPPYEEQQAIAASLWAVQQASTATQKVIGATRELKRSLMRHLFTYGPVPLAQAEEVSLKEAELGPMPEHWQVGAFRELVDIQSGMVDPRTQEYRGLVHVGPENIEPETGRIIAGRTAEELGLISGKYLFSARDVLYSKIRPYLRKVGLPTFEGLCSADMYPLRPSGGELSRDFLFHYLLSESFTAQAVSFQDRTGIPKINRQQLGLIQVPVAPPDEQAAIAEALSAVDAKLNVELTRESALGSLFDSALNELMTGRRRVTAAEVA